MTGKQKSKGLFDIASLGTITPIEVERPEGCICDGSPWGCWDPAKGNKALIASDGERSLILEQVGGHLDYWFSESGDQEGLDGYPPGVWVWEGTLNSWRDYWGEYDEELSGDIRKLTDEEWELLRDGEVLFPVEEFMRCSGGLER